MDSNDTPRTDDLTTTSATDPAMDAATFLPVVEDDLVRLSELTDEVEATVALIIADVGYAAALFGTPPEVTEAFVDDLADDVEALSDHLTVLVDHTRALVDLHHDASQDERG